MRRLNLFATLCCLVGSVAAREVKTDQGLAMQPDEKIQWMLDAKLGMFIHWGLYAGPARGEWYMENAGVSIDDYRRLAYPESGDQYFDARDFDADAWMELAQQMGARYTCFTTQHHDGYCLFESHYPSAFTSHQTHNRDFVREYVDAARRAGMRVGLYKTLINWRHPGYYDVTGTDCKANKFGYTTAAWHREDARQMKEELYFQTRELMTNYGRIDHLFWDGGWLAQKGTDADAAYFWEPGMYRDPANPWPIQDPLWENVDTSIVEKEPEKVSTPSLSGRAGGGSGRPLGLMGLVRTLQPDIVANLRSGWCGDFTCEEGGRDVRGNIREGVVEKCFTITPAWGYQTVCEDASKVMPLQRIERLLADCFVRNMVALVNVGPDRHGHIPDPVAARLRELGTWMSANAEAIYGTRGGPWQPVEGQYGFTCKGNKVYVFLLGSYTDATLTLPALPRGVKVRRAYIVESGQKVRSSQRGQAATLTLPAPAEGQVTVIAVELNKHIQHLRPAFTASSDFKSEQVSYRS